MPYNNCMDYKGKYTREFLEPIVKNSRSISQVLREIGLRKAGGNHRLISGHIRRNSISTSHFTGQAWNRGKTTETSEAVRKITAKITMPDEEVFVKNSPYNPSKLRARLLKLGWDYKCSNSECGISLWLGKEITLHVDHINGNHIDHRLENLQFLCPNCHQQTRTWGNKRG